MRSWVSCRWRDAGRLAARAGGLLLGLGFAVLAVLVTAMSAVALLVALAWIEATERPGAAIAGAILAALLVWVVL